MRQRSKQACIPCRRRKRKCNGKMPCDICKGYGYDCEYEAGSQTGQLKRRLPWDESLSQPGSKVARLAHSQDTPKQSTSPSMLPGVLEPSKARYVDRYSSIAFPLYVGLEVQATKLPRLHSFAYHTGIRKEPPCSVSSKVTEKIPWNAARRLIEVYTAVIHPIFGFLDMKKFRTLCEEHWHGQPQDMVFEAVISGVIALASLFSGQLDQETEMWFMLHAKEILEDCAISRFPSLEQIAAWILRIVYVRCTGRPHVAWLSSCTVMHLVEATGLHHAPEFVMQTTGNITPTPEMSHIMNRTAQVARCLHVLIAFEYGRSIMSVNRHVLEQAVSTDREDLTPQLCALVATVPTYQSNEDPSATMQELFSALDDITELNVDNEFLALLRADLALGIYRRLRVMDAKFRPHHNDRVIAAGTAAIPAARKLACQNQPWWNVIGSVFQFTCALLVMDAPTSGEKLSEAMESLEVIVGQLDTHLAREALSTARQLVRASLEKKRKDIDALERIIRAATPEAADGETQSRLSQAFATLSPSLTSQSPLDVDSLWAMEFQLPL